MGRTSEASGFWREIYPALTREVPGRIGKFLSRGTPHVLRLSLSLALLDRSTHTGVEHVKAAYALWQYCEQSVLWAYSSFRYSPCAQRTYSER